jgi:hypothetical protein
MNFDSLSLEFKRVYNKKLINASKHPLNQLDKSKNQKSVLLIKSCSSLNP